ncbi:MAG: hypothetical protein ACI814_005302, partial [Mariniblastus sp.]
HAKNHDSNGGVAELHHSVADVSWYEFSEAGAGSRYLNRKLRLVLSRRR